MLPTLSSCCFYAEDLCALEVPVFYNLYLLQRIDWMQKPLYFFIFSIIIPIKFIIHKRNVRACMGIETIEMVHFLFTNMSRCLQYVDDKMCVRTKSSLLLCAAFEETYINEGKMFVI